MVRVLFKFMVLMVSLRVAWLCRILPLDRLIERIRKVPVLPESLRKPQEFQAIVNRWYTWLPPRRFRPCMKRSYLLLDLWTRCGLKPEFHLGIQTVDGVKKGHAWLEVEEFEGFERFDDGYEDAFVS